MMSRLNLHFSRLSRVAFAFALSTLTAQAFSQLAPEYSHNPVDLFPNVGGRPEFLTVFDMRQDTDTSDRVLAKSVQGLYNAQTVAHDKIYLIFNDNDASLLDWLVKQQFVLSAGYPKTMDQFLLRWPNRDAIVADSYSTNAAVAAAGCERWLVVTNENLVSKYHLNVRENLAGRWTSEGDADAWLQDKYGDQLNKRVVTMPTGADDLSMTDYSIANRVFSFGLSNVPRGVASELRDKFDANIPCLSSLSADAASTNAAIKQLSENAKFLVPLNGLSNLSVLTTFRPFDPGQPSIYWGTINDPRKYVVDDLGEMHFNITPYKDIAFSAHDLTWLRDLAPPLFESTANTTSMHREERDAFRIGLIDESSYGAAFGEDRDRIWTSYLELSRDTFDQVRKRV